MMEIHVWQIILLTFLAGYAQYDGLHALTGMVKPVVIGFVTGIIMGDVQTGLFVGGTINLMALGIGNFGGASVPDYMSATMLGTVFAITSGQGAEFGVAAAVPIGVLLVQIDVFARFSNLYFAKKADKAFENREYNKIIRYNNLGVINWGLSRALPVFIGLSLGPDVVNAIIDILPTVFLDGMKTAGGILPAIGLAILLRYMPLKENVSYLLIGFVLAAYLNLPILAVAIIGLACAVLVFRGEENNSNNVVVLSNNNDMIEGDE